MVVAEQGGSPDSPRFERPRESIGYCPVERMVTGWRMRHSAKGETIVGVELKNDAGDIVAVATLTTRR